MDDFEKYLDSILKEEDSGREPSSVGDTVTSESGSSEPLTPEGKFKAFKDLMGDVESSHRFDIGNKKSGGKIKLVDNESLTTKTVEDIMNMQKNKDLFAAGKYQIIPQTLKDLVRSGAIDKDVPFDADAQELLADYLIENKRKPLSKYLHGEGDMISAGKSAAKEWASLPVLENTKGFKRNLDRGESYYAGGKHERAHVTPEQMEDVLEETLNDTEKYNERVEAEGKYSGGFDDKTREELKDVIERKKWNLLKGME